MKHSQTLASVFLGTFTSASDGRSCRAASKQSGRPSNGHQGPAWAFRPRARSGTRVDPEHLPENRQEESFENRSDTRAPIVSEPPVPLTDGGSTDAPHDRSRQHRRPGGAAQPRADRVPGRGDAVCQRAGKRIHLGAPGRITLAAPSHGAHRRRQASLHRRHQRDRHGAGAGGTAMQAYGPPNGPLEPSEI